MKLLFLAVEKFLIFYRVNSSVFDIGKNILTKHTKRIFGKIEQNAKRKVEQFTFGTTNVQLNPNYQRFDRLDPLTWKKEGILRVWSGMRGYRRSCCKNCCSEYSCQVFILLNH